MTRRGTFSGSIVAGMLGAGTAFAAGAASPPDFSPSPDVGWISNATDYYPPPSGPQPVKSDPAHPFNQGELLDFFVPNPNDPFRAGQPTFRIADLSNPILQPWAREELRKRNEAILAGKPGFNRQVQCWPIGVPGFVLYGVQPTYFIQTPKEVLMIWQSDHQIRRVYLNVPHSANVKPSWYGESVGHYEGDTLVVDTVGMNERTYVDNYRTPHSEKLHVVERFRMIEGGQTMEVNIRVEDPGAFTVPWEASMRYRRVEPGPLLESACAENNINPFHWDVESMPEAARPDF